MRTKRLTLQQRREIFLDLVQTQDENTMSVPESRQSVIKKYKITDMQLKAIEEEGSDKDWPPLNMPLQAVGAAAATLEALGPSTASAIIARTASQPNSRKRGA